MHLVEGIPAAASRAAPSTHANVAVAGPASPPSVEELLDVDREYRQKAEAGTLQRIAPRRMNPRGEAWLPVLHTHRGARGYTALFSNTPRAHRLGTTHDWVVICVEHDGSAGERQSTVITARFGPLKGQRIVRGREDECLRLARRKEWEKAIGPDQVGSSGATDSPPAAPAVPPRWH